MPPAARILEPGQATALHWWSAPALSAIARAASARLDGWCQRWAPTVRAQASLAWEADDASGWRTEPAGSLGDLRWCTPTRLSPVSAMHALLFEAPPAASQPPTVALALARQALDDWTAALASIALLPAPPGGQAGGLSARGRGPWSGAVRLDLSLSGRGAGWSCAVELAGPAAAALVASAGEGAVVDGSARRPGAVARGGLQPLGQAVGGQALPIEVRAGDVEIDLGTLRTLRVGDVLMLPLALDQPLPVHLAPTPGDAPAADRAVLCQAHLGARQGRRAIELCAATADARPGPQR